MKFHLKRIVGNSTLNFEEMCTVLSQVEACLNSRPLCPLTEDAEDLAALTPGHFLIGDSLFAAPDVPLQDINLNRLDRWQLMQRVTQDFWKRWSEEYLSRLQSRPKWKTPTENLKVGELVLVKELNLPPTKWRLGRILQVHPDADGCVRVISIRTSRGNITRPVTEVSRLPDAE